MINFIFGWLAEIYIIFLLLLQGWNIIGHRVRSNKRYVNVGEIDIIVYKKDIVVFIEVKARKDINQESTTITFQQRCRIMHGAKLWLSSNKFYQDKQIRFDAFFVNRFGKVRHIINAWGE